jgi:SpoVK/Ycf46/Vps4 family AAA+-type ATPase
MGYSQWNEVDGGIAFSASDQTVPKLPPGVYALQVTQGVLYWVPVENRTDEIIRFPETPIDEVVAEIQTFWTREDEFKTHGLPYKRGILLWGPPGSGKTSTLAFLTRDVVERGGVVVMFNGPSMFTTGYRMFRMVQPDTPLVVLMEDLDEILDHANQSEILNLLDGVEATHKVVFLATTNYPEKLGPRIVNRPSRFDRRFKIGHPNETSRRIYIESLIRPGDDVNLEQYARDTDGMSLAHVKELFVATALLGSPYDRTVRTLQAMKEKATSAYDEDEFVESLERGYA